MAQLAHVESVGAGAFRDAAAARDWVRRALGSAGTVPPGGGLVLTLAVTRPVRDWLEATTAADRLCAADTVFRTGDPSAQPVPTICMEVGAARRVFGVARRNTTPSTARTVDPLAGRSATHRRPVAAPSPGTAVGKAVASAVQTLAGLGAPPPDAAKTATSAVRAVNPLAGRSARPLGLPLPVGVGGTEPAPAVPSAHAVPTEPPPVPSARGTAALQAGPTEPPPAPATPPLVLNVLAFTQKDVNSITAAVGHLPRAADGRSPTVVRVTPNGGGAGSLGEFVAVHRDLAGKATDGTLSADYLWSAMDSNDSPVFGPDAMWLGPTRQGVPVPLTAHSHPDSDEWRAMRRWLGDTDSAFGYACVRETAELRLSTLRTDAKQLLARGWLYACRDPLLFLGTVTLPAGDGRWCQLQVNHNGSVGLAAAYPPAGATQKSEATTVCVWNATTRSTDQDALSRATDPVGFGFSHAIAGTGITPAGLVLGATQHGDSVVTIELVDRGQPERIVTRVYHNGPRAATLDTASGWPPNVRCAHHMQSETLDPQSRVAVLLVPDPATGDEPLVDALCGAPCPVTVYVDEADMDRFEAATTPDAPAHKRRRCAGKEVRVLDAALLPDLPPLAGQNVVVVRDFDSFRRVVRGLALWGVGRSAGFNERWSAAQRIGDALTAAETQEIIWQRTPKPRRAHALSAACVRAREVRSCLRAPRNSDASVGFRRDDRSKRPRAPAT